MKSYKIRIWPDGAGYWTQIRDGQRNVVHTSWGIGTRKAALADARQQIVALEHQERMRGRGAA